MPIWMQSAGLVLGCTAVVVFGLRVWRRCREKNVSGKFALALVTGVMSGLTGFLLYVMPGALPVDFCLTLIVVSWATCLVSAITALIIGPRASSGDTLRS